MGHPRPIDESANALVPNDCHLNGVCDFSELGAGDAHTNAWTPKDGLREGGLRDGCLDQR